MTIDELVSLIKKCGYSCMIQHGHWHRICVTVESKDEALSLINKLQLARTDTSTNFFVTLYCYFTPDDIVENQSPVAFWSENKGCWVNENSTPWT